MSPKSKAILGAALAAAMIALLGAAAAAGEPPTSRSMSGRRHGTRAPIGWVEFCNEYSRGMRRHGQRAARRRALAEGLEGSGRVNKWVNDTIKPITDMEHWGVVEQWSYPDDGNGDCEDYVLLKRRMLMQAGWPREALLITVVRDKKGDGHAVLTVKTDKGEFILDNQEEQILLWSETGYRFVKRQSQTDPNIWVSLGDPRAGRSPPPRSVTLTTEETTRSRSRPHPSPSPDRVRARPASPNGRPQLF